MKLRNLFLLLILAISCSFNAASPPPQSSMHPVDRTGLCITDGKLEQLSGDKLSVSVPKMRAFVNSPTLQQVEARFTYLGPTKETSPLASGEIRRQFGVKLRAQDGCNLVYAMWRIDPQQELVVSVKSNPGMTQSSQCDAHGYHNIKPTRDVNPPQIVRGKKYTLRAIIDNREMRVYADNKLVWEGDLGADALAFNGPVGVRSDNGQFQFVLYAEAPAHGQQGATAECRTGSGEE